MDIDRVWCGVKSNTGNVSDHYGEQDAKLLILPMVVLVSKQKNELGQTSHRFKLTSQSFWAQSFT